MCVNCKRNAYTPKARQRVRLTGWLVGVGWLFGALKEALLKVSRYLSQMALKARQRCDPFANPQAGLSCFSVMHHRHARP
jgi:hypothetical protein